MSRRKAEEERQKAATLVQQAWSGGYKRAYEVGGAIFVAMGLIPYVGWHGEKDLADLDWSCPLSGVYGPTLSSHSWSRGGPHG